MIDRHYGHLAHDSCQNAVSLLDALAYETVRWTLRGRRTGSLQSRSTTAGRVGVALLPVVAWTLGGRRASFLSPHPKTKGAYQQGDREAL